MAIRRFPSAVRFRRVKELHRLRRREFKQRGERARVFRRRRHESLNFFVELNWLERGAVVNGSAQSSRSLVHWANKTQRRRSNWTVHTSNFVFTWTNSEPWQCWNWRKWGNEECVWGISLRVEWEIEEAKLQWRSMKFSLSFFLFLSGSVILSLRLLLGHLKYCESNVATLRLLYYCWIIRVRFQPYSFVEVRLKGRLGPPPIEGPIIWEYHFILFFIQKYYWFQFTVDFVSFFFYRTICFLLFTITEIRQTNRSVDEKEARWSIPYPNVIDIVEQFLLYLGHWKHFLIHSLFLSGSLSPCLISFLQ